MNVQQRKTPANERKKPRMLKDFLSESSDSCPSGAGFKSFPTQPFSSSTTCSHDQCHSNPNVNTMKLLRSRSKAASAATISAVQALINAFKKYPPMFLSRKKYYSSSNEAGRSTSDIDGAKIRFRVKDIVRWSSFKDLVEEKSRPLPLEVASSPDDHRHQQQQQYYYYCTTTNSSNTTCSSSSNCSSWCESDFTSSEYLLSSSSWHGKSKECVEHEVKAGKKYLPSVGRECLEVTAGTESYADMEVGPKIDQLELEEKEQQSPVSVLDFQVGENEEPLISAFTRSLACVERTRQNLMQKIQRFESLAKPESFDLEEWMSMEENTEFGEVLLHDNNKDDEDEEEEPNELDKKVRELVNHVKVDIGKAKVEQELVLLDFFLEQLSTKKCQTKKDDDDEFEREMVSMAKAWTRGEHNGLYELGLGHKREAYVREMDRRERWSKFEEEQQEVALEIETQVLGFLLDEVFVDLFLRGECL